MALPRLLTRPALPRRTIRLRLTAVYAGLFLLSGAGLLAITYGLVRGAIDGNPSFCEDGPGQRVTCTSLLNGRPGTTVGAAVPAPGASSGRGATSVRFSSQQVRVVAAQMRALSAGQHASELHWLLVYSALALAIMAVLSGLLGWLVAGRMLRPLRSITGAVRDISATSLHRRLALAGPGDELKELGDTFDGLLARLEASFAAQRQFVANASHELRTPLAWQRTFIQVELADPDADARSLRAAHERVLTSGAHQERIIEALLTLSRSQAGLEAREPFDLAALAGHVLHARQAQARAAGLAVRTALRPAPATGDPRLTERLIANLADNALRHNTPGGHVEIATGLEGARAVLSVRNTGPVVPAESVDRILQPFQRLGTARTGDGLGLGLSIVQAVAEAHGADLTVRPRPRGGLRVDVSFAG